MATHMQIAEPRSFSSYPKSDAAFISAEVRVSRTIGANRARILTLDAQTKAELVASLGLIRNSREETSLETRKPSYSLPLLKKTEWSRI